MTKGPAEEGGKVPIDTELVERLARRVHEAWMEARQAQGWRWGPTRDDARREHPDLVPYDQLAEADREFDRRTVVAVLQALADFGHRIERDGA